MWRRKTADKKGRAKSARTLPLLTFSAKVKTTNLTKVAATLVYNAGQAELKSLIC